MTEQLALGGASEDDFESMKNYHQVVPVVGIVDGRVTWVPGVCTVHPRQQGSLFPLDRLVHTDGSMWTVTAVDWDRTKGSRWSGAPATYTLRRDVTGAEVRLTGAEMEDYWRPHPDRPA